MEAFKDFPIDYVESLKKCLIFLNIFNIRYLEEDQPFLKRNWRFFYIGVVVIIHIIAMISHMPVLFNGEEISRVAFLLPPILVTIHSICKAAILLPNTANISAFIRELGTLWRRTFTTNQIKEKGSLLWQLKLINGATYWVTIIGSSHYLLSPLLETVVRRFILHQDAELVLPIAASYPFNPTKNWLIYILVYIFQLYTMLLLVSVYTGSALIMITLCALLGAEFQMLKYDLAEVKPRLNKNGNKRNDDNEGLSIEEFVKRHQKLIGLSRQLDNAFNGMIFIDLLFVGITTCAFSFAAEVALNKSYKMVSYIGVISSMLTVFYLCYFGELLTGASARIGDIAYQNLWYKGVKQYKVAIWLIIKISQRPCRLTSLKYAVVSLNLFTKVVSTTWSYLSLMNSVYSEEE